MTEEQVINKFKDSKFVFVAGIGGSDLASKALWNALSLHKPHLNKKVFYLESPDEREYSEVQDCVDNEIKNKNEFVFFVISKSGETKETLKAYENIFQILTAKFPKPVSDRVVVISTPNSPLWKESALKNIITLPWAGEISGRFSAFTVAHTAVLGVLGVNVESFKKGGDEMRELCKQDKENNPAILFAKEVFEYYKKSYSIWDFFIFNDELEDLGKWSRQLIAESISLITPTVSLGPTDLHSMLELYLGGPKNRFSLFIVSHKEIQGSLNSEIFENITAAYKENALPFEKFEMVEISEFEIGQYMEYLMQVTIELGKLLEINIFDQPAVDRYKAGVRKNSL